MVIAPARSPIRAITAPRGFVDTIIIQAINPDQLRDMGIAIEDGPDGTTWRRTG